jgi:hypothetical protein
VRHVNVDQLTPELPEISRPASIFPHRGIHAFPKYLWEYPGATLYGLGHLVLESGTAAVVEVASRISAGHNVSTAATPLTFVANG